MFELYKKNGINSINVNDLNEELGKISLIDIRETFEYIKGHIPTSENIPMEDILNDTDEYLDKSKKYFIVCHSGGRSARLCRLLDMQGYDVVDVVGGTMEYEEKLEK